MADASAPDPLPELLYRGGRTLPKLIFKNFYYGPTWRADPDKPGNDHPAARVSIDAAIDAAMRDVRLNGVLQQYFGSAPITTEMLASEVFDADPSPVVPLEQDHGFDETDVERVIRALAPTHLTGLDLSCTAINIVLPRNILVALAGRDTGAGLPAPPFPDGVPCDVGVPDGRGLAGYHGSVCVDGFADEVLYSVTVWSEDGVGIKVEDWQPWESMVATLYHELQEIRTNPDVDRAIRLNQGPLIGWNTDIIPGPGDSADCREIGDLGLVLNRDAPQVSFIKVLIADPPIMVPIQKMWSNTPRGLQPES